MKFLGLGAAAALGVMLSLPVLAQTTTTQPPAVKPPMAVTTPPPMTTTMPPAATRPTTPAPAATTTTATPAPGKTAKAPAAPMAPVDINSATAVELDKVKFIGPARAKKIIAGRPWASTDDLVTKKVLPRSQYDQVKANLMVR